MSSDEDREQESRGFRVIDRRGRSEEDAEPTPAGESGEPAPGSAAEPASGPAQEQVGQRGKLPSMDFSTLVLSLSTSALYHLGLVEDPETGQRADPDLAAASQTIDTLEILKVKTAGNLEDEESRLLDGLLYELRLRFVEVRK